jgi:FKBP-type peptidyl-prolyl cis-trans isomerase (trigger factor)
MYEQTLNEAIKEAELPGFRKGLAPRELVLEKTDISKLYGEVINELLEKFYPQALKEKMISPLSNPRVEIKEFDLEKDFEFTATVATKPETKIKDFRPALKTFYEDKAKKLSTDNAEKITKGEEVKETHAHLTPNELLEILLEKAEVEVPEILVEEEADRLIGRLANQAKTLGLSLEQYLTAQNKSQEDLKKDYIKVAENSLKAEFVLTELIKSENIEVSDEEIEEAVKATGDPTALEKLKNPVEKWYIKSILQKNNLVNKLIEEIQGKHDHE